MKLEKPSPALIAELKWVASQLPLALPRKMFGYDALFVNGNMAVGLWQNTCVIKVSAADQAELLKRGVAKPFAPMKGRVMSGWLELSEELAHDPEELLAWSERAVAHTATLPPKARKTAAKSADTKPQAKTKLQAKTKPQAKAKTKPQAKAETKVSAKKPAKAKRR